MLGKPSCKRVEPRVCWHLCHKQGVTSRASELEEAPGSSGKKTEFQRPQHHEIGATPALCETLAEGDLVRSASEGIAFDQE